MMCILRFLIRETVTRFPDTVILCRVVNMKKSLFVILVVLLVFTAGCYAQEDETTGKFDSINALTFVNVSEFGMSYDRLMEAIRNNYVNYDCEHKKDSVSDTLTCTYATDLESHKSQYFFDNDRLFGEVCTSVIKVEGFTKETAFRKFEDVYDLTPFENCDNDFLDTFVNTAYEYVGYYTFKGGYTYLTIGGSDETDTDWTMAFIGIFDRDYVDGSSR